MKFSRKINSTRYNYMKEGKEKVNSTKATNKLSSVGIKTKGREAFCTSNHAGKMKMVKFHNFIDMLRLLEL